VAVGVHTTQFEIRDPKIGLLRPVLELAAEEMQRSTAIRIAGVCGPLAQALNEAQLARDLGYHAVLLSLAALREATTDQLIQHAREIAAIIPVIGFYLQPAVGGRPLPYAFWRRFAEIPGVVAIKIAPFNRYQTCDVVRSVVDSGRSGQIALYTGNDDNIIPDLLTEFRFAAGAVRIVGGLLGQWAVWTHTAAKQLNELHRAPSLEWLTVGQQLTDANAALFDPAHGFQGCIPGIHEILRRQGLLRGRWCLREDEDLSPGQMEEIDRVCTQYPHLTDDEFVREHLDEWLR
jgi:dihydrodipicolinate synthase/N-acetylneuraminate lyase